MLIRFPTILLFYQSGRHRFGDLPDLHSQLICLLYATKLQLWSGTISKFAIWGGVGVKVKDELRARMTRYSSPLVTYKSDFLFSNNLRQYVLL